MSESLHKSIKNITILHFQKFARFIFKITNQAIDLEIEDAWSPEVYGGICKIVINLNPPLFWRRKTCNHEHALKTHPNFCLRCNTLLTGLKKP